MVEYTSLYRTLGINTLLVVFLKKDASIRIMLATRNRRTIELCSEANLQQLDGHDKRCGIENGNIAVYDLVIDEARSFNINRVISVTDIGEIRTEQQLDNAVQQYKMFKEEYEKNSPMQLSMDTFK